MNYAAIERTRGKPKLLCFREVDAINLRKARDKINSKTGRLDPIPTWILKDNWDILEPFLVTV